MKMSAVQTQIAGLSCILAMGMVLAGCQDDPVQRRAIQAQSLRVSVDDGTKCLHPSYAVVSVGQLVLRTPITKVRDGDIGVTPSTPSQWRVPPNKPIARDYGADTDLSVCQIVSLAKANQVYLKYRSDAERLPPLDYVSVSYPRHLSEYEHPYELRNLRTRLDPGSEPSARINIKTTTDMRLGRAAHEAYIYSSNSGNRYARCYRTRSPIRAEGILTYCTILFLHEGVAVEAGAHSKNGHPVNVPRMYDLAQETLLSMLRSA